MGERRPGPRRQVAHVWNAHLILREDQRGALEELATTTGRTISDLARRAIDRGLPLLARGEGEDGARP